MEKTMHESIEDFLDDQLNPTEKAQFEARLETENALADELRLAKTLRSAATEKARAERLRKTLAEVGADFFDQKAEGKIVPLSAPKPRIWLLAAGFAVAASLAFLVFSKLGKGDLYEQNRVFPAAAFVEKSGGPAPLMEAQRLFNDKNWPLAEAALSQVIAKQAEGTAAEPLFYLALAKMEQGKTAEARALFQKLQADRTTFAADATFFEALSFLKDGDPKAATELLKKLGDGRSRQLLEAMGE